MSSQLAVAERARKKISSTLKKEIRSELGQFMTPEPIARFMADLFVPTDISRARLLDAGAGMGSLSCAFLDRFIEGNLGIKEIDLTAYELDIYLHTLLENHLRHYSDVNVLKIINDDYIKVATKEGLRDKGYTHVILNPPYRKITSKSEYRLALRSVGIETVNLYSAFISLALFEAAQGAQIVAIMPRSFCNGTYYKSFRQHILKQAAIRDIHLFDSRTSSFKDDGVLQENIIIRLEKGARQGRVMISRSTDGSFQDITSEAFPFERVVHPGDKESFIRIPSATSLDVMALMDHTLEDLGLQVSTGPVIDFRMKEYLVKMPDEGTCPLIYPAHLGDYDASWPIEGFKKWNAIQVNDHTRRWLWPSGHYCAVKRFSPKEQRRRIMASTIKPSDLNDHEVVGFENHLNVYHQDKKPIDIHLAKGLTIFLNSSLVDNHFREFNGSTQVNATDLRQMKYPSKDVLMQMGDGVSEEGQISQKNIDRKLKEALALAGYLDSLP